MWSYARSFLASFEVGVIAGSLHLCDESNSTDLRQGGKFQRLKRAPGAAAAEPAQITDIVLRFLSNLQEDSAVNDSDLDRPVEDFNDALYSLPTGAVVPDSTYFN
jgi:hypothetical protein